jgi:hypothetical protein
MLVLFLRESAAMYTVSLRNLRGKDLRESLLKGTPLVVTNRDVLIGFLFPWKRIGSGISSTSTGHRLARVSSKVNDHYLPRW